MHIALCEDNVADRKQFERLVKRESDRRSSTTGILYLDCFGSLGSLLMATLEYDIFYIDMCQSGDVTGKTVVEKLVEKGVKSPIVMCCSKIDYKAMTFPENVFFLDKPIKESELSETIDKAISINANKKPRIEIRADMDTFYLEESDFLYAVANGRYVDITLSNQTVIKSQTSIDSLFSQMEKMKGLFCPSYKTIININYIKKLSFHKATMIDGTSFHVPGAFTPYIKEAIAKNSSSK